MKKIFLSFLLVFSLTASAQLAQTHRLLGYSTADTISNQGLFFGTADTYPVGAAIEPSMLSRYKGCKIVGIRFALSDGIPTMSGSRIFIYSIVNGQILDDGVTQSVRRAYPGWNTVFFNGSKGYVITGNETLLFGFDYIETEEMITAENGGLCTVGNNRGYGFLTFGKFGSDYGWYSMSDYGNLCVQLIVDISSMPQKDIRTNYLFIGNKYKKTGDVIDFLAMFDNVGRDSIFGYQLGYRFDDGEPVLKAFTDTLKCDDDGSWEEYVDVPANLPVGRHTFSVFVDQIEGKAAAVTEGDTLTETFFVYANPLPRQKHYLEQYVHESSPYVPYCDAVNNKFAHNDPSIAMVNVHAQGTRLAIPESAQYEELYAYTYPSFTIDRFYYPGEAYIAFDVNDYVTIMPSILSESIVSLVAEADLNPAFATVDIVPQYDETTRQLTVKVSGDVSPDAEPIFGQLALTVMLAEDSVKSRQAVYNEVTHQTKYNSNYIHNDVLRRLLTAVNGDALTVSEGHYSADFTCKLPTTWNPEKLKVVAFVTRQADSVTDDNVLDMDITNANSTYLREHFSAIRSINAPLIDDQPQWYTLDGRRLPVKPSQPGVYILRQKGQSHKVRM